MKYLSRFFLLSCILLQSNLLFAQHTQIADSLLEIIKKHPARDTIRAQALMNYAKAILYVQSDSTVEDVVREALEISNEQSWVRGKMLGYQRLGVINGFLRSDYPAAIHYYNLSLIEAKNQKPVDSSLFFQTYSNIAAIYLEIRSYKKSLKLYEKAIKYLPFKEIGTANEAQLYTNLANPLAYLGFLDSALSIHNRYDDMLTESPYYFSILASKGQMFNMKGKYAEAIKALAEPYEYHLCQTASVPKVMVLGNLAVAQAENGNIKVAKELAIKAIATADSTENTYWRSMAHEALAIAFKRAGDYSNAMKAYEKFIELKDSAYDESKVQEISFLEVEGEFQRKADVEAVAHAAELSIERNKRYGVLGGASLLLFGGMFVFYSFKKRKETQALLLSSQFKEELASTELKALRAQMNPHFIFNSLNSIADYIDKQDPKAASGFTTKFAKLMRLILENSEKKEICLADELKALELYMQLEAQRMNNKFTYQVSVDDNIDPEETLIPPLLLQPFVENSIWHGIAKKKGTGHINVRIQKEAEMINCIIEDDGIGRVKKENVGMVDGKPAKQSLGMKITQSRIDILNKLKNSNAGLQLTDLAQGLRVELRLPLELSF